MHDMSAATRSLSRAIPRGVSDRLMRIADVTLLQTKESKHRILFEEGGEEDYNEAVVRMAQAPHFVVHYPAFPAIIAALSCIASLAMIASLVRDRSYGRLRLLYLAIAVVVCSSGFAIKFFQSAFAGKKLPTDNVHDEMLFRLWYAFLRSCEIMTKCFMTGVMAYMLQVVMSERVDVDFRSELFVIGFSLFVSAVPFALLFQKDPICFFGSMNLLQLTTTIAFWLFLIFSTVFVWKRIQDGRGRITIAKRLMQYASLGIGIYLCSFVVQIWTLILVLFADNLQLANAITSKAFSIFYSLSIYSISFLGLGVGILYGVNLTCLRKVFGRSLSSESSYRGFGQQGRNMPVLPTTTQMALKKFHETISDNSDDALQIFEEVGRGAYGTVYKGRWRGTVVAIKMCESSWRIANGEEAEEDLKREARAMHALRHPNIVLFMAAGLQDGRVVIVSEFCSRGNLHDLITTEKDELPLHLQHRLALGTAKGLLYLHRHDPPLIHRDLKSPNILVDEGFSAKIADFGTIRVLEAVRNGRLQRRPKRVRRKALSNDSSKTRRSGNHCSPSPGDSGEMDLVMTAAVGTPRWTAPEILAGQLNAGTTATYSTAVDIFSYGMVLYEITTGKVPFEELGHTIDVYEAVTCGKRPLLKEEDSEGLPAGWILLIQRCWAQDPGDRPSAEDIVSYLCSADVLAAVLQTEEEDNHSASQRSAFSSSVQQYRSTVSRPSSVTTYSASGTDLQTRSATLSEGLSSSNNALLLSSVDGRLSSSIEIEFRRSIEILAPERRSGGSRSSVSACTKVPAAGHSSISWISAHSSREARASIQPYLEEPEPLDRRVLTPSPAVAFYRQNKTPQQSPSHVFL